MRRESKEEDIYSDSSEDSIIRLSKQITQEVSSIDDILSATEQVETLLCSSKSLPSPNISVLLEMNIIKIAMGIVSFPGESIEQSIQQSCAELSPSSSALDSNILRGLSIYYYLTSELFEDPALSSSYIPLKFLHGLFEVTTSITARAADKSLLRHHFLLLSRIFSRTNLQD